MSQKSERLAFEAGRQFRITPNDNLPPEAVADPVSACPFEEGSPDRTAWLRGYVEAHAEENTQAADIKLALADAVKVADSTVTSKGGK